MIRNKHPHRAAALAALLLSGPVWALESDRNQPIEIEADQGSLDQGSQSTVFSGNVQIRQGSMYINAARVEVNKDASGNQNMKASGKPVTFGQQLEKQGMVKGQANEVRYTSQTGIVTLSGNAKVERGSDMARGHTIIYNTRTEVYTVSGGNKGRVSVVIQPQNKK